MSYAGSDPYGVRLMSGTLITCDSAAKQIILHLDEGRPGTHKFVMRDVDESHVLVKSVYVEELKGLLQAELEKNTYVADPAAC
ncbi:unnamed protein product [Cutaneotrichosporon oleaginosum]